MKKKFIRTFVVAFIVTAVLAGGGVLAYTLHSANATMFSGKISKLKVSATEPEFVILSDDGREVGQSINFAPNADSIFPILTETEDGSLIDQNGKAGEALHQAFLVAAKGGDLNNVGYSVSIETDDPSGAFLDALRVKVFEGEPGTIAYVDALAVEGTKSIVSPFRKISFTNGAVSENEKILQSDSYYLTEKLAEGKALAIGIYAYFDEATLKKLDYNNKSPNFKITINLIDGVENK